MDFRPSRAARKALGGHKSRDNERFRTGQSLCPLTWGRSLISQTSKKRQYGWPSKEGTKVQWLTRTIKGEGDRLTKKLTRPLSRAAEEENEAGGNRTVSRRRHLTGASISRVLPPPRSAVRGNHGRFTAREILIWINFRPPKGAGNRSWWFQTFHPSREENSSWRLQTSWWWAIHKMTTSSFTRWARRDYQIVHQKGLHQCNDQSLQMEER